jgi:phosphatidylglycerophosphate synthase
MCDRAVEIMVALAVAKVTGHWFLMSLTLSGALMVSYAKARAAMEAPVTNLEWPDLMERAERSVGILVGLAASVLVPWRPLGRDLFWWTLVVVAALTYVTVAQRVLRARQFIAQRSGS